MSELQAAALAVRLRVSKTGKSAFISHLDLQRTMARALFRARVPVRFSEGFNPHPQLSFARPLSLGFESECELCDVQLEKPVDKAGMRAALNAVMPEGIEVSEVYEGGGKPSEIALSAYEIRVKTAGEADLSAVSGMLSGPVYEIKRTKRGAVEVDISGMIRRAEFTPEAGGFFVSAVLRDGPDGSLNPSLLLSAAEKRAGAAFVSVRYTRTALLKDDGTPFR